MPGGGRFAWPIEGQCKTPRLGLIRSGSKKRTIKSYLIISELVMRSTQQFSITLPNEMAQLVRGKVTSGEYATESEVIRDGLRTLLARDKAVEAWLKNEVAPAYDAIKANPSSAIAAPDVRKALAAEQKKALKAR
jgi:antitoxin ParD1/3/4